MRDGHPTEARAATQLPIIPAGIRCLGNLASEGAPETKADTNNITQPEQERPVKDRQAICGFKKHCWPQGLRLRQGLSHSPLTDER